MLEYPQFDPVMIHIGPLALRWYGMMYVLGILSGWMLGRHRAKKSWNSMTPALMDDFVTWGILGVVLGGRIGYVLFYNFAHYIEHPLKMFAIWEGGMSFHGGLIGVLLVIWLFGRAHRMSFLEMGDFVSPLIPPGLFFGRIGNFINGELWGRYTDHPFGMIFPGAGTMPRHPSQLYEAALEGVVLFILVWWYSAKPRPAGCVGALFLLGYGVFRFMVEFARQPDAQLGFVALQWMTMGQILCVPMILFGIGWIWNAYRKAS